MTIYGSNSSFRKKKNRVKPIQSDIITQNNQSDIITKPEPKKKNMRVWAVIGISAVIVAVGFIVGIVYYSKSQSKSQPDGFESNMNKLSLYHLHGCPHCVALMPVWNRLKKKYGANMAEYEANANPNLMNSKGIHSYPTILFGDKHYKGDRSYKDLESFLLNNLNK